MEVKFGINDEECVCVLLFIILSILYYILHIKQANQNQQNDVKIPVSDLGLQRWPEGS